MKKYTFFLLCLFSGVLFGYAQCKPSFKFCKTVADFGVIDHKKNKQVIVKFKFNNLDTIPFVVLKAVPMCSCMTTEIPQLPIYRGQQGIVQVTIDLENQVGEFNKAVIVRTTMSKEPVMCRIVGVVK